MRFIRKRHALKQGALAIVSMSIVVVIVGIWVSRHGAVENSEATTLTLDLRAAAPLRGGEESADSQPVTVARSAVALHILLPPGSEGTYEAEIDQPDPGGTRLTSSGRARIEGQSVVLELPIPISRLQPGRYWLVLKRNGSESSYYAINVK